MNTGGKRSWTKIHICEQRKQEMITQIQQCSINYLDAVPNAVAIACPIPARNVYGFFRVKKK